MKLLAWVVAVWFMAAGSIFIRGKMQNDGRIAQDTARVADSLDKIVGNRNLSTDIKESCLR